MKKATKKSSSTSDALRDDYQIDYSKAKPNRFAGRIDSKRVVVVLDNDVAKVFKTPEAVNRALRAVLAAVPSKT
jgi:hypothetical protein